MGSIYDEMETANFNHGGVVHGKADASDAGAELLRSIMSKYKGGDYAARDSREEAFLKPAAPAPADAALIEMVAKHKRKKVEQVEEVPQSPQYTFGDSLASAADKAADKLSVAGPALGAAAMDGASDALSTVTASLASAAQSVSGVGESMYDSGKGMLKGVRDTAIGAYSAYKKRSIEGEMSDLGDPRPEEDNVYSSEMTGITREPMVNTFDEGMMDWFATSEQLTTETVNGVVTYPYGVEEGKFQGVDREAYKTKDGTYRDRDFAVAVFQAHKKKLKSNHPEWDTYPLGVREALASYKWNYGLGNNVVKHAVAAAKETDPAKQKALFKKSMISMLDTFGAKDTAKGVDNKGAMTGLVKRRANDYNRAATDLGYKPIATYSLNNKGSGAEAVYKDADGNVISTQKSTYKVHTNNRAVTDKNVARVDKTNWNQMIA
tara:strand:+ start:1666 stop:2970 length:1305 start_codon:yes stop_codon:yes gene_type:complete